MIILAVLVAGVLWFTASCRRSTADGNARPGLPEVAVTVLQAERVVLTTELPGRTSPFLIAEVRPQVTGIIQKRLFTEGSDVKVGTVLYRIDPASYEAAYAGAKAALARAEANILSIRSRAQRYKELVSTNAVSRQDVDDVMAALAQAEAEIEANKAAVETARINLAYTNVKSPISGRIGKSNVTVGALVTANQPIPLAVIQQLDPIYVDATQSSANMLDLKKSIAAGRIKGETSSQAKVKLLLENGNPYPLEGTLKFADVTVEPSTGSFILRMVFPNPKETLLPGMYVRPIVQEGTIGNAILAPQQGISRDPKGNPVALVAGPDDKVQPRIVTIDRAIGDKWLVSEGLKPGDRLIVEGIQKVRPGMPVKTVPFKGERKDQAPPPGNGKAPAPPEKPAQPPKPAR